MFRIVVTALALGCVLGFKKKSKIIEEEEECRTINGQIPWKKGICKDPMQILQPDFQPEKFFSGTWYQEQSMGTLFSTVYRKCIQVTCSYADGFANLTISEYVPLIFSTVTQSAQVAVGEKPQFQLDVRWLGVVVSEIPVSVLSTDYDNYVLVYSCTPAPLGLDGYISELAFVLRRKRGDRSRKLQIRQEAWKNGIPYEELEEQDNKNCPAV